MNLLTLTLSTLAIAFSYIFSPATFAATGVIEKAKTPIASFEMYSYKGLATLQEANSTNTQTTWLSWSGGQAFDASAVPCREQPSGPIVLMGFHSTLLHYRYSAVMAKQFNQAGQLVDVNTVEPSLVWNSPNLATSSARNMRHWMGGCFFNGTQYVFPTHSENYFAQGQRTAKLNNGAIVKAPNIVTVSNVQFIPPNNIATSPLLNPSLKDKYLSMVGLSTNVETNKLRADMATDPAIYPQDGHYWGGYDLNIFTSSNGVQAGNNSFNKAVTVIKAPSYTPVAGSKIHGGKWCQSNSGCTDMNLIDTYGQYQFSNLLEWTESGVTYVAMFSEHRPVGFMRFADRNYEFLNANNKANDNKPNAFWNSDPNNSKLDAKHWSNAPILVRAVKSQMLNAGAWQVFGWGSNITNETSANASWVSICSTCTVDATLPVSSNNIHPYLFFINQQSTPTCSANGDINNCVKYNHFWSTPLAQSIRIINNKIVQFGATMDGQPWFSWSTSLNNPLGFEQTLTKFTFPNNEPIPSCSIINGVVVCPTYSQGDFSVHSGRYMSVFDQKASSINMGNFVDNGTGIYTGSMLIAFRGGGRAGASIDPEKPTLYRYNIQLQGL
jgi:hypothetical protein